MSTVGNDGLLYYMIDVNDWNALLADESLTFPGDLKEDFMWTAEGWGKWIMAPAGSLSDEEYDWLEDQGIEIRARSFRPSNQPSYLG